MATFVNIPFREGGKTVFVNPDQVVTVISQEEHALVDGEWKEEVVTVIQTAVHQLRTHVPITVVMERLWGEE